MFSEPDIVRSLLQRFITPALQARLDFDSLYALPTEQLGDSLQARRKDTVWRIRLRTGLRTGPGIGTRAEPADGESGWLYLVLMIEFQTRDDAFMVLRANEYSAMLYRTLARQPEHAPPDRLPLILPIVIYNGKPEWKGVDTLAALLPAVSDPHLQPYVPSHRAYLLIDEVRLAQHFSPVPGDNLSELLIRFETSPDHDTTLRLIWHAKALLAAPAAESLRLGVTAWLNHIALKRFLKRDNASEPNPPYVELDDMPTVFEINMERLFEQKEREAHQASRIQMLTRQLTIRFGPLPEAAVARLQSGTEDEHTRWAERLLNAPSLGAVFSDESLAAH